MVIEIFELSYSSFLCMNERKHRGILNVLYAILDFYSLFKQHSDS